MVPLDRNGGLGQRSEDRETLGSLEYFSTGALSLAISWLCLAVLYGWIVALVQPLHVLSTTALVVAFLTLWAATWLVLDIVWGWQSGRLSEA
ncbi:hypothetical protein SAMN05216559_3533 [Halomicrobium zhouii]|uniref:Uncharacterized protein n=1 Tax=Halomicrobium zhouii TaxID=767519 RepID=A0A1I6LZP7_9EURY|nr:hypothetical protein [Halomicrobium zhouii]SFS08864.1 hypothetical protein SAMN05216559_3533 [Halomicrobium zhouii]